ncbi:MAG TPA: cytochrome c maturation protein CcmE [Methylocystis sp.]|nr:cytochrome c maturation protein CcmE [Methylocystis sp.]
MTRKGKRLTLIISALGVAAIAVGIIMYELSTNISFFKTPTELIEKPLAAGTRLRLGGLVKQGSVKKSEGGKVDFVVTDNHSDCAVTYKGLLPDLFREGQGVVADGVLQTDGVFHADSVLAKHDERYMPKEVADALKKQGVWQGGK